MAHHIFSSIVALNNVWDNNGFVKFKILNFNCSTCKISCSMLRLCSTNYLLIYLFLTWLTTPMKRKCHKMRFCILYLQNEGWKTVLKRDKECQWRVRKTKKISNVDSNMICQFLLSRRYNFFYNKLRNYGHLHVKNCGISSATCIGKNRKTYFTRIAIIILLLSM